MQHRPRVVVGASAARARRWCSPLVAGMPWIIFYLCHLSCSSQLMDSDNGRCGLGNCSREAENRNTVSSAKVGVLHVTTQSPRGEDEVTRGRYTWCGHLFVHASPDDIDGSEPTLDASESFGGAHRLSR